MTTAIGIVVNPKLKTPLLATWDESFIYIRRMDEVRGRSPEHGPWPSEGIGYYDTCDPSDSEDYWLSCEITGLPRVHTPRGVQTKKMGYGTCLYTALCLGAHQNHEKREERVSAPRFTLRGYGASGDGISSRSENRSSDAEIWWTEAKRRRLAYGHEDEQTEEGVDATSDLSGLIEGESVDDGTVSGVNNISVDVARMFTADAYPYENAVRKNLIVADFTIDLDTKAPQSLWRILQSGPHPKVLGLRFVDDIEATVEIPWLMALDVRGLTLEAINLLGILAQTAGADEDDLDKLRLRWELQFDPETPITQMRLPFKANTAESRAAHDAVEQVRALRAEADWDSLADLP